MDRCLVNFVGKWLSLVEFVGLVAIGLNNFLSDEIRVIVL